MHNGFGSLRVFKNEVLRRIFVHKRDEVTGRCRKLYNEEEPHNLYSSDVNDTDQIKVIELGRTCRMHEMRSEYILLFERIVLKKVLKK
jgi:hypothetical protein